MCASTSILIDGSEGEGGGQILRSSLALSAITGRPFRIENIRSARSKPGLMRQHLTAVNAAREVSGAKVRGAEIGSTALTFEPGPVNGGEYQFSVGTAGSATLVAQTVLPALMLASKPSHLVLEGGTHNPMSPPFEFFEHAFLPHLRRMGVGVEATLHRPGFYPAGGGRFVLEITPAASLEPIEILERGEPKRHSAEAIVSNLPRDIAERELEIVATRLGWSQDQLSINEEKRAAGPGNILMLTLEFEHLSDIVTGFGERGLSAQAVAKRAVEAATRYLRTPAAVGHHLADQLLLLMAVAGNGRFTTLRPSLHTRTNVMVIRQFLPIDIGLNEIEKGLWQVTVGD